MNAMNIIIERKELIEFFIAYIQTHTYIKSKFIAWDFLQAQNFSRTYLIELTPLLCRKLQHICLLALKYKVISQYARNPRNITYKVENIENLPALIERLDILKEKSIKIIN